MNLETQRELIPRHETRHLIGALDTMKAKLLAAAEQWRLLTESGGMPASPSYTGLLQHAADAQGLSRDIVQLTADFTMGPHSTKRVGRAVLGHLAIAATMSCHAAAYFAETAEIALALSQPSGLTDRDGLKERAVTDHGAARAYLRCAAGSLRNAVKELGHHLDVHRSFPAPSRSESPVLPPPGPGARQR
ncbi:hypothetical protein OIC43_09440 [Streptomyces sp. NBC_00825]|uniref:hypothetical protein n=1 Tax=unclassified Streptomyces TaxID=2593676 RepID=UPI002ED655CB|nr:hypothetical protein OG832_34260 [Streptomyces sp. NBC_00826]WTH89246.1 hypothetical protein OIC43_09440 [Streptomyces sp. NBC_00825]WTH97971.1 hypothetical protein OHA23_09425 [Streptomyces sp. NBC_00822]